MSAEEPASLAHFLACHQQQLDGIRLPASLRKIAYKKLYAPLYLPQENLFQLRDDENHVFKYLIAKSSIRKYSDVWLIPHILTGTAMEVYSQILEDPALCERLWKMMNLDLTVKLPAGDHELIYGKPKEAAPESSEVPAGAQPALAPVAAEESMIETVMEFGDVTREEAVNALVRSRNDLIAAIAECQYHEEFLARESQMNKNFFGSYQGAEEKKPANEQDVNKRRIEKKAQVVFAALFELNFIGQYHTMQARAEDSPYNGMPPQPEEIKTQYYVMHECGQHIAQSDAPSCKTGFLVAVTLKDTTWTLLWPDTNISMAKPLTRPRAPKIPFPGSA